MKKIALLSLIAVLSLYAGKKNDLEMLNQQVMDLQEKNVALRDNNKTLDAENKQLKEENKTLSDKVMSLENTITAKNLEIKDLVTANTKLRQNMQTKHVAKPDTIRIPAEKPEPKKQTLLTPEFPLIAEIIKDPVKHNTHNLAVLLSFYNGSNKNLEGFVGTLQFHQNGELLLECAVNITKKVNSAESVTWYGAVPFDPSKPGNLKMLTTKADAISVIFDTEKITLPNGSVQKVK